MLQYRYANHAGHAGHASKKNKLCFGCDLQAPIVHSLTHLRPTSSTRPRWQYQTCQWSQGTGRIRTSTLLNVSNTPSSAIHVLLILHSIHQTCGHRPLNPSNHLSYNRSPTTFECSIPCLACPGNSAASFSCSFPAPAPPHTRLTTLLCRRL